MRSASRPRYATGERPAVKAPRCTSPKNKQFVVMVREFCDSERGELQQRDVPTGVGALANKPVILDKLACLRLARGVSACEGSMATLSATRSPKSLHWRRCR